MSLQLQVLPNRWLHSFLHQRKGLRWLNALKVSLQSLFLWVVDMLHLKVRKTFTPLCDSLESLLHDMTSNRVWPIMFRPSIFNRIKKYWDYYGMSQMTLIQIASGFFLSGSCFKAYSPNHPLPHSLGNSSTHPCTLSLTHLHQLTHFLSNLLKHSFTWQLIHPPTTSLTQ